MKRKRRHSIILTFALWHGIRRLAHYGSIVRQSVALITFQHQSSCGRNNISRLLILIWDNPSAIVRIRRQGTLLRVLLGNLPIYELVVVNHTGVECVLLRVTIPVLRGSHADHSVDVKSVVLGIVEVQAAAAVAAAGALVLVEETGADLVGGVEFVRPVGRELLGADRLVFVGDLEGPQLVRLITRFSLTPSG